MTITSKQIFRAISHYQETNGVAKQIEERVKLAELIYSHDLNFKPVLLKHYYLYDKGLSLIGPSEWNHEHLGEFLFTVKQLGDGTWQKI